MKSPNPMLDTSAEQLDRLFRGIELGDSLPYCAGATSRQVPDALSGIARDLITSIAWVRSFQTRERERPTFFGKAAELPAWADDAAALPEFTGKTIDEWWSLTKKLFLKKFPTPQYCPEFEEIAPKSKPYLRKKRILDG
jgi:hypothetical protein